MNIQDLKDGVEVPGRSKNNSSRDLSLTGRDDISKILIEDKTNWQKTLLRRMVCLDRGHRKVFLVPKIAKKIRYLRNGGSRDSMTLSPRPKAILSPLMLVDSQRGSHEALSMQLVVLFECPLKPRPSLDSLHA